MANKFDRLFRAQSLLEKKVSEVFGKSEVPVEKRIEQIKTLQVRLDRIDYSEKKAASIPRKPILGI